MTVAAKITPSPDARSLFGQLVARADDNLVVTLGAALALYADRKRSGRHPQAEDEISELVREGWVESHPSGGWIVIYEEASPVGWKI